MSSGLEKIIEKINEENIRECENIENKAKQKAEKIIADEIESAKADADKIIAKAKADAALTDEKAKSGSALLEKKIKLEVKNQIIAETVVKIKERLKSLPTDEYLKIVQKLVTSYAKEGEGTLKFSSDDFKKIPADFEKTLNSVLPEKTTVKISDETINADGGFILSYDDIEENCTFDALIDTNIDAIRDKLNSKLFA